MKTSLLACIVTIVLLSSCGSAKTETNTTQDSNTNISEISEEKLIGADCQDLSEKTQLALVEKNTNPDVSFEFLDAIYVENQASCYLQVKIENSANPETPVYSLFNVVSEKTYKSFNSLEICFKVSMSIVSDFPPVNKSKTFFKSASDSPIEALVASKLNYLIVGEDAGSKLEKDKKIASIKIMTEAEFIALIK